DALPIYAVQNLTPNYKEVCNDLGIKGSLQNSILKHYDAFSLGEFHDLFTEWAKLNHTIGALIPIPPDVNVPRYVVTGDQWDLMMYSVYQWYKGDSLYIDEIFKASSKSCVNWLKRHNTWESFVEKNYLQNFVYGTDGQPLEFYDNHFGRFEEYIKSGKRGMFAVRNYLYPKNNVELKSYLNFVINSTKNRGR